MREMDAFEQAYKNGFAAGLKAAEEKIVHCKDCKHSDIDPWWGTIWCGGRTKNAEDFCSQGERMECQ